MKLDQAAIDRIADAIWESVPCDVNRQEMRNRVRDAVFTELTSMQIVKAPKIVSTSDLHHVLRDKKR